MDARMRRDIPDRGGRARLCFPFWPDGSRLRNPFSKKIGNHAVAVALYFMYYNFGRAHQMLRVTPAMEAGVSDHAWSIEEIVGLWDAR